MAPVMAVGTPTAGIAKIILFCPELPPLLRVKGVRGEPKLELG
jgi:hypothetical protein